MFNHIFCLMTTQQILLSLALWVGSRSVCMCLCASRQMSFRNSFMFYYVFHFVICAIKQSKSNTVRAFGGFDGVLRHVKSQTMVQISYIHSAHPIAWVSKSENLFWKKNKYKLIATNGRKKRVEQKSKSRIKRYQNCT